MERPRFFTHAKVDSQSPSEIPMGKILKTIGLVLVALVLVGFVGWKAFAFGKQVIAAWPEIWFAFNKPAIVKPVMANYDKKEAALDQAFETNNPDQTMLQAVKTTVDQEVQNKLQTYSFR